MDDNADKIREALATLDTLDDDLWTSDGAPKVEAVSAAADLENLKRADIINAAPKFSRTNNDVALPEPESESEPAPLNTQGYNHPEIIAAQVEYNECVAAKAKAIEDEKVAGDKLSKVTDRLMRKKIDKQENQRGLMAVIKASSEARANRVAQFNANRALVTDAIPRSALDQAKSTKKSVRPLMNK